MSYIYYSYGNTISSTWRTYLAYVINETPTSFEIEANSFGVELTSSTYMLDEGVGATRTFILGSQKFVTEEENEYFLTQDYSPEDLSKYYGGSLKKLTIQKTTSPQNVDVSFALSVRKWRKSKYYK